MSGMKLGGDRNKLSELPLGGDKDTCWGKSRRAGLVSLPVTCLACTRVHLVSRSTGRTLGDHDE
jgi:hypothetical protein